MKVNAKQDKLNILQTSRRHFHRPNHQKIFFCRTDRQIQKKKKMALFEDADNFADIFRGGLPYYLLLALPILIICSANPVLASSEFTVQRMSQFDVNGVSYGEQLVHPESTTLAARKWSTRVYFQLVIEDEGVVVVVLLLVET